MYYVEYDEDGKVDTGLLGWLVPANMQRPTKGKDKAAKPGKVLRMNFYW